MRRRRRLLEVSTFPFLAVLLCAMGSLILVLLVMDRKSKLAARARVEQTAARQAAEYAQARAALLESQQRRQQEAHAAWEKAQQVLRSRLTAQKDLVQGKLQAVHQELTRTSGRIEDERKQLAQLQQMLQAELERLGVEQKALARGKQQEVEATAQGRQTQGKLAEMTADLVRLEQTLNDLKEARKRDSHTFSVIPYKGKRGENRRPLYIECAVGTVFFHPEKIPMSPQLQAGAVRSEAERRIARQKQLLARDSADADQPAYLMLLIRPTGIPTYYALLAALRGLDVEFGYELVDPDWILEFPPDDEQPLNQPWMQNTQTASATPPLPPDGTNSSGVKPVPSAGNNFRPRTSLVEGNRGTRTLVPGGSGLGSSRGAVQGVGPLAFLGPSGSGTGNLPGGTGPGGNGPGAGGSGRGDGTGNPGPGVTGYRSSPGGTGLGGPGAGGWGLGNGTGGNDWGGPGSGDGPGGTGPGGNGPRSAGGNGVRGSGAGNGVGGNGAEGTASGGFPAGGSGPGINPDGSFSSGNRFGQLSGNGARGVGAGPPGTGSGMGQGGNGPAGIPGNASTAGYPGASGSSPQPGVLAMQAKGVPGSAGASPVQTGISTSPASGVPGPGGTGASQPGSVFGAGRGQGGTGNSPQQADGAIRGTGAPGPAGISPTGGVQPLASGSASSQAGAPGARDGNGSSPGGNGPPQSPGLGAGWGATGAGDSSSSPGSQIPGSNLAALAQSSMAQPGVPGGGASGSGGNSPSQGGNAGAAGAASASAGDPASAAGSPPQGGSTDSAQGSSGSPAGGGGMPSLMVGQRGSQGGAPADPAPGANPNTPNFAPAGTPGMSIGSSGGRRGDSGDDPAAATGIKPAKQYFTGPSGPPLPPQPGARPRRPMSLRPAMVGGDRDYIIFVECRENLVVLYPSRQAIPVLALTQDPANNLLLRLVQQMIDRRQGSLRPGELPYRPQVRFLVRPEFERTYHLAYPTLERLAVPKTRQTVEPEDDVLAIISGG